MYHSIKAIDFMGFNKITAAEAAALIQNGDTIGLSGFTPAGVPKSVPAEIAKRQKRNMPQDGSSKSTS